MKSIQVNNKWKFCTIADVDPKVRGSNLIVSSTIAFFQFLTASSSRAGAVLGEPFYLMNNKVQIEFFEF